MSVAVVGYRFSRGRTAVAFSATFRISCSAYNHAMVPSSRPVNLGARSGYFSGTRPATNGAVRSRDHPR